MVQQLAPVMSAYGLGALVAVRRADHGYVDENWIVETEQGRYFVKRRHPRRRQPERVIQAQHDLIAHLRISGFPAPSLVPTSTGQSFLDLDGELYEVERLIDGEPFDHQRSEHLAAAASTLGRYHCAVEGFRSPSLAEQGPLYSPENARATLARLRETWQLGIDPDLELLAQELEVQADGLAERFGTHETLPHLVIHGDFYAGNLLFENDRITGVVDYDKASWQPRVAELAEALIYFSSPRPGHLRHLVYPGVLEWEQFGRFLHSYGQEILLEGAEVEALPDYIACIWFTFSLRRLLEHHPDCPSIAEAALREVLELGDWARAHARRMVDVAREWCLRRKPL